MERSLLRATSMDEEGDTPVAWTVDCPSDSAAQLVDLWRRGLLTDVTLAAAEGTRVSAHRVVLAAASPFFRAMFAGSWSDGAQAEVALSGVSGATLEVLVSAVYTRELCATPSQLPALLAGATHLALAPLAEKCAQQLRARLCFTSALATASLACALGVVDLETDADAFAAQHFDQVLLADTDGVLALPEHRLERLLSSDCLKVVHEADALDALLTWATGRPEALHHVAVWHVVPAAEERMHALPRLLKRVRLALVPQEVLLARAREHPACVACPEAGAMLQRAAQEKTRLGMGYSGQPRESAPLRLLVIGGHDADWRPLRSAEWYDTRTDTWRAAPALPQACNSAFINAVVGRPRDQKASRKILAIGGSTYACTAFQADAPPPEAGSWLDVKPYDGGPDDDSQSLAQHWSPCWCPTPRQHAALVCKDSFQSDSIAFIIGGRAGAGATELSSVELYCFGKADVWFPFTSLSCPRASGAAAILQESIYVAGGQAGRSTFGSVEVLHPGRDEWTPLPGAKLCQARKYLSLAPLRGCLYAVGGMQATRARLDDVERLDPREGKWCPVARMHARRSSAGCVAADGALWVAGGYDGELYHDSMEKYDDRMDVWTLVASMATARSGAAMVAV